MASRLILDRYDPTHTTTLRNNFAKEMKRRFLKLRSVIRKAIVDEDCFGLSKTGTGLTALAEMTTPGPGAFAFTTSADKVDAFMEWLNEQVQRGILEVTQIPQLGRPIQQAWTDTYINSAYRKGVHTARQKLIQFGYAVPSLEETGGIDVVMESPFHADRVGLLYTRTFNDLKNITNSMSGQISRVLAQAMAEGRNPRQIAQLLVRTISGPVGDLGLTDTLGRFIPAQRRAEILARTEIIRAHHVATVQEYRNWKAEGVTVQAEWSTAGDGRVCGECAQLEGKEYTLDEIENLLPRHPQCRCIALPVDKTKAKEEQQEKEKTVAESPAQERKDLSIPEDMSSKNPIFNILQQDPYYSSSLGHEGGAVLADNWLVKLTELQQMDGLPTRVSREEFDSIKGIGIFRGVTDPSHKAQFFSGEYFAGTGIYGNGYYFSTSKKEAVAYALDEEQQEKEKTVAESPAQERKDLSIPEEDKAKNVIEAKLPQSAKIISWEDLKAEMEEWSKKIEQKTGFVPISKLVDKGVLTEKEASVWMSFKDLGKDPGRYCAMKGYDAIRVSGVGGEGADYLVVVNRTAVVVPGD